jgi:hypothetical protein
MYNNIDVVLTNHAKERAARQELDVRSIEEVVCGAASFAPQWAEDKKAAALDCPLPVDPVVKYLGHKAIVTTLLPHGVPLKANTEVVYVV